MGNSPKNGGNIKRINPLIVSSTDAFPGSTVVAMNASADYGADNTAHGNSENVCEVCHTLTTVHKFNMPAATAHNGNDCIGCHQHKKGFRASCDACHGNPPVDAGTLVFSPAATGSSNSDGWGAHAAHVTTESYTCDYCHGTTFGAGVNHTTDGTGSITIEFNASGSTAGNYDGQAAVTNAYDGTSAGTVDDSMTCDLVYCHGGTLSGTSPAWNGAAACGSCHAFTAGTVSALPSGTSHNTHANAQGLACTECHAAGAGGSGHVNGDVNWDVSGLPSGSSPTYSSADIGTTGGLAPSDPYGTCSNIACHNNVETPAWNGSTDCTTCHAAPPTSGAHEAHYTAKSWTVDNAGAFCDSCHPDNTAGHTDVTNSTIVLNAGVEWSSPACFGSGGTVAGCHNGNTTPDWTTTNIACTDCHTVGGTNSATVANPETGLHGNTAAGVQDHDNNLSGGCEACHVKGNISQHWNGVASATPIYTEAQSGVNTLSGGSYVDNAGTGANRGTCTTDCHSDNGNWSRQWSSDADGTSTVVGNARCDVCHGQWTTWAAGTTHYKAGGANSASNSRGSGHDCTNCHAYADARHDTTPTHQINLNNNGATPARTGTYPTGTAGCGACHGTSDDSGHNFPISYFAANYVSGAAVYGPACSSCHDTAVAASKSAPAVDATSSHVSVTRGAGLNKCEDCHSGHSTGVVIPNNSDVGIDYSTTGHTGIGLGGSGTVAAISGKTSEAEICWGCHDADGSVSEWGTNTDTNGGETNYNFGTVYTDSGKGTQTSSWIGSYWTSANFTYKDGTLNNKPSYPTPATGVTDGGSTHAASSEAGTAQGIDAVGTIRCSYCHDVHDTFAGSPTGAPFLRGNWMGNPYLEDGAPTTTSGTYYTEISNWGRVPRGGPVSQLGGFMIDQNNGNPTAAATWTPTNFGGLCDYCHGTTKNGTFTAGEVDALNQYSGLDWVSGLNGHLNVVKGASHDDLSAARNIFAGRGGATNQDTFNSADHPYMNYSGTSKPGETTSGFRGWFYKDNTEHAGGLDPTMDTADDRPQDGGGWSDNEWGTLDKQGGTVNATYHQFSCSKCHTPHASRLPALMITNCLDTKNNKWDNTFQLNPTSDSVNASRSVSNWSSAQNCHRLRGVDPDDAGDVAAPDVPGNRGWNTVTPW